MTEKKHTVSDITHEPDVNQTDNPYQTPLPADILEKLQENPIPRKESDKAVKKFLATDHKKMEWLSVEGSSHICAQLALVLTSTNNLITLPIKDLPQADQEKIQSSGETKSKEFLVSFNGLANFNFQEISDNLNSKEFVMGNILATLPPESKKELKVESDMESVCIGDKIKLSKKHIQKLVPETPQPKEEFKGEYRERRQKTSGRNAYEIRSDLVEIAMELLLHNNKNDSIDPENIVKTARLFYTFVERK